MAQATDALTAAYCAEVEYRRRDMRLDEATKANIRRTAEALTAEMPKPWLMLCGLYGNGKTTMLRALQSVVNWLDGSGLAILDAKQIVREAQADYGGYRKMCEYRRVAVEDMGREPMEVMSFGNMMNPIVDLLEYRYDEQMPTMISTNLMPSEIRSKYGDRIADRLNEMATVIVFKNASYRK